MICQTQSILNNLIAIAIESNRPLEQLQLAEPSTLSGLVLRKIMLHSGANRDELAELCKITPIQSAGEIKRLKAAGLISCIKNHNRHSLFISVIGRELLDNVKFPNIVHAEDNSHKHRVVSAIPLLLIHKTSARESINY